MLLCIMSKRQEAEDYKLLHPMAKFCKHHPKIQDNIWGEVFTDHFCLPVSSMLCISPMFCSP